LKGLIDLVRKARLDFGVAFDGDADRSLFVTRTGKVFDGDSVLYVFSRYFQARGELKSDRIVGTIMSNFALEKILLQAGLKLVRAAVGDKYVLEEMENVNANLGGEPSGHVILRDYHTTGDGILTALKLAEIASNEGLGLDELASGFTPYPQFLDSLRVSRKIPLKESPGVLEVIAKAERQVGDRGRIVVRYSGTEPVLRIMAEGEDAEQVRALVGQLKLGIGDILAAQ
jgi:phosphoglucosamine mutase